MIRELQNIELYKQFINKTANYKNKLNSTLEGIHLCRIPDLYKEYFKSLPKLNPDSLSKNYISITSLFEKMTESVYVYNYDSSLTLEQNFKNLLPIILNNDTYGILIPLPTSYSGNYNYNFKNKEACYLNLTNPLALIDSHSYNNLKYLCNFNENTKLFIFKYDSSEYSNNTLDLPTKEFLHTYLNICCSLFYNSKIKKQFNDEELQFQQNLNKDIFFNVNDNNYYIEHFLFNLNEINNKQSTYLTYSDIIIYNSIAPHYAILNLSVIKQNIVGSYIEGIPFISPNINPKNGLVCTGKYANYSPEGLNTLIESNLLSSFTDKLINKNYMSYWIDINKYHALKWLENLLNISIL